MRGKVVFSVFLLAEPEVLLEMRGNARYRGRFTSTFPDFFRPKRSIGAWLSCSTMRNTHCHSPRSRERRADSARDVALRRRVLHYIWSARTSTKTKTVKERTNKGQPSAKDFQNVLRIAAILHQKTFSIEAGPSPDIKVPALNCQTFALTAPLCCLAAKLHCKDNHQTRNRREFDVGEEAFFCCGPSPPMWEKSSLMNDVARGGRSRKLLTAFEMYPSVERYAEERCRRQIIPW